MIELQTTSDVLPLKRVRPSGKKADSGGNTNSVDHLYSTEFDLDLPDAIDTAPRRYRPHSEVESLLQEILVPAVFSRMLQVSRPAVFSRMLQVSRAELRFTDDNACRSVSSIVELRGMQDELARLCLKGFELVFVVTAQAVIVSGILRRHGYARAERAVLGSNQRGDALESVSPTNPIVKCLKALALGNNERAIVFAHDADPIYLIELPG